MKTNLLRKIKFYLFYVISAFWNAVKFFANELFQSPNLSSENGSMDKLGDNLKFLGSHQLINQEQFEKFINETVKAYNKYSRKSAKTASEITKLENEKNAG